MLNVNLLKLHSFFLVDIIFKKAYIINMMKTVRNRNIHAKSLTDSKYRQRIVVAKKGRGSYNRKKLEKKYA
jgi:stalled ribosome alternative rescue factor ArfA